MIIEADVHKIFTGVNKKSVSIKEKSISDLKMYY